jgi:hypothetical protein
MMGLFLAQYWQHITHNLCSGTVCCSVLLHVAKNLTLVKPPFFSTLQLAQDFFEVNFFDISV